MRRCNSQGQIMDAVGAVCEESPLDDEHEMGEMLHSLSHGSDGCVDSADEDFADLFDAPEEEEDETDLFARVGSADIEPGTYENSGDDDTDGIAMFEEEAEVLASMYPECRWNDRHDCFSVQVLPESTLEYARERRSSKSKGVVLNILRLRGYPQRAPEVCVEPWHNLLSGDEVHRLYTSINEQCASLLGTPLLSSICSSATFFCDSMVRFGVEEVGASDDAAELKNLGVKARASHEKLSPSLYIGGIAELIAKLPKGLDVINVENVLKPELALRFEKMQRYFFRNYVAKNENRKETKKLRLQQHILKLADIRPAFHGTRMVNVGKIVRSGLLVPGQQTGLKVATGSRYGQGIYSSPDPDLALSYAGSGYEDYKSVKLMVVAVLMGKEKLIPDGMEPWGGGCTDGFDSHISQDGRQYVVFHEAQILPCYVLHLMEREQRGHEVSNTLQVERHAYAGRAVKSTAILTQMARKNLPFGFGPRGSNFVVEAIADASDDEEDWGEFQELRGGGGIGHEEYQHETLLPPPPPPAAPKAKRADLTTNPNR